MVSLPTQNEFSLSIQHTSELRKGKADIPTEAGDASTSSHVDRAATENQPKGKKRKSKNEPETIKRVKKEPAEVKMVAVEYGEYGEEIAVTGRDKTNWSKNGLWIPHTNGKPIAVKLWKVLPCRFRFFCNGNIMILPTKPYWLYIFFGIICLSVNFVIFDVLPYYVTWSDLIPGSLFIFLSFISAYNLLHTVMSDPGITLPHWFSNHYALTAGKSGEEIAWRYGYTSYCSACKISKTPTTIHCHECHACIAEKDHHCKLLGTCVGKRNYRSFYIFIVSLKIVVWIGLIVSITHLVQNWMAEGFVYAAIRASTLYLIISTIAFPPLGLVAILLLPVGQTLNMFPQETAQSKETDMNLTLKEKLSIFWSNFNHKVIKKAPSQIPPSKLQSVVYIPAIPRTKAVEARLKAFQEYDLSRNSYKMLVPNSVDRTEEDSRRRKDTAKYERYCAPVWNTKVAKANEAITISITDQESVDDDMSAPQVKVERPQRKGLFFRCFNQCVFTPPAFPVMKSSIPTDRDAPRMQTTVIV